MVHARMVGVGDIIYCGARRGRIACDEVTLRQMINWPDAETERLAKLNWCQKCLDKMIDDIKGG